MGLGMEMVVERRPAGPIQKIAVLRALYVGDLLLSVPAFRSLRAAFPDAEITLISLPWARHLQRHLDRYLDRFVAFDGYPGLHDVPYMPERSNRFIAEQRAYEYDLVIQMHGSGGNSNPCARDLGGRVTAGYYRDHAPEYLFPAVPYPEHLPERERCLRLAGLLGGPDLGLHLEFALRPTDQWLAGKLLSAAPGTGPIVGIHAGARSPQRRWPPDAFAALADSLISQLDARIVLTGMPDEQAADAVRARLTRPVLDLSGRTSLGTLAAVLASMDLLVVNNTGPAHLAEAVGTPTVRVWDLEEPGRWDPPDRAFHRTVSGSRVKRPFPDGRLWTWPSVEDVLEQALDLLDARIPA